jgi:hypothetical protein
MILFLTDSHTSAVVIAFSGFRSNAEAGYQSTDRELLELAALNLGAQIAHEVSHFTSHHNTD